MPAGCEGACRLAPAARARCAAGGDLAARPVQGALQGRRHQVHRWAGQGCLSALSLLLSGAPQRRAAGTAWRGRSAERKRRASGGRARPAEASPVCRCADPSYLIRSIPTNSGDRILCKMLAHGAGEHAAQLPRRRGGGFCAAEALQGSTRERELACPLSQSTTLSSLFVPC